MVWKALSGLQSWKNLGSPPRKFKWPLVSLQNEGKSLALDCSSAECSASCTGPITGAPPLRGAWPPFPPFAHPSSHCWVPCAKESHRRFLRCYGPGLSEVWASAQLKAWEDGGPVGEVSLPQLTHPLIRLLSTQATKRQ